MAYANERFGRGTIAAFVIGAIASLLAALVVYCSQ